MSLAYKHIINRFCCQNFALLIITLDFYRLTYTDLVYEYNTNIKIGIWYKIHNKET